jgi:murein DD-endopeptidase MepM/ murein hydrolase activator NlpD
VQGDTLIVLFTAPAGADVTVRFDGSVIPVFAMSGGIRRALIGTDPDVATGEHTIAVSVHQDEGARLRISRTIHLIAGDFGVRNLTLPPKIFGLITPQNLAIERRAIVPALSRRSRNVWWHGPFQVPSSGLMDSPYGLQGMYNGHREWWHQGVDFSAPEGSPVVATNEGVVVLAQMLPLGGGTIIIDHGHGVLTEYLHMSAFDVRVGDHVTQGTIIGKIGATGLVTGPSIHWGLYVNGIPVNPLFWLEPHPGLTS